MKIVLQDGRRLLVRFDKDEDVIEGLKHAMQDQNIQACVFEGIGSATLVELGYYNQHLKEYRHKPYAEEIEVISLNGNGAMSEDGPAIHAHGMFGRTDFTVFGGHVFKLITAATCEIFLIKMDSSMNRKMNADWNLKLLD